MIFTDGGKNFLIGIFRIQNALYFYIQKILYSWVEQPLRPVFIMRHAQQKMSYWGLALFKCIFSLCIFSAFDIKIHQQIIHTYPKSNMHFSGNLKFTKFSLLHVCSAPTTAYPSLCFSIMKSLKSFALTSIMLRDFSAVILWKQR